MNAKYRTLAEAKGHPNGLAVLGFFFQVGLQLLEGGDPLLGTGPSKCGWWSLVWLPRGSKRGRKAGPRPGGAGDPQWCKVPTAGSMQ